MYETAVGQSRHEFVGPTQGSGAPAPSQPGASTLSRRWVGPVLAGLVLAAVLLDTFARGTPWAHEWQWASVQFHFSTVLTAPLVAGLTALIPTIGPGRAVPNSWHGRVRLWWFAWRWTAIGYCSGFLTVLVWLKARGLPNAPAPIDVLSLVPALALFSAVTICSVAAGLRWRARWLCLPIAGTCLAATIGCYLVLGAANPLTVGGATASLVGLRMRPELMGAQVAFFVCLSLIALGRPAGAGRRGPGSVVLFDAATAAALVATAGVLLTVGAGGRFVVTDPDPDLVCREVSVTICVAPGYEAMIPSLDRSSRPYLDALERVGLVIPGGLRQGAALGADGDAADVTETLFRPVGRRFSVSDLMAAVMPPACRASGTDDQWAAADLVHAFLDREPEAVGQRLSAGEERDLRAAVAQLADCRSDS